MGEESREITVPLGSVTYARRASDWYGDNGRGRGWKDTDPELKLALDSIERLTTWKAEAVEVLSGWNELADEVFEAMGRPARMLGRRGVDVVQTAIEDRP